MVATKTLLSEAIRHHQSGRLSEAEHLYKSAIATDPLNAEALHLLGLLAHQTGRGDIAVELIGQAISIDGTNAAYHVNYGVVLEQLGRLDESLDSYNLAIRLRPNYAQAFYNRASALHGLGRLKESLASYEAAIRTNPDFAPAYIGQGKILQQLGLSNDALLSYDGALRITNSAEAHFCRGNSLYSLERFDEALLSYDFALQAAPEHAEAMMAKAAILHRLGKFEEAITSYDMALAVRPDYTDALFNRAAALQRLGLLDEALDGYDQILRAQPTHLQTLLNRGNVFHGLARYTDALSAFDVALEVSPASVQAHSGRGAALHDLGKIEEALVSYENALRIDPNYAEAHSGRGAAQHDLGRLDEALESYKHAIQAQPDHAEAHTNRGLTLLLKGELEAGWSEYAWRWKTRASRSMAAAHARLQSAPLWTGEPGAGRRILIWSEQGLGDTIQFARFIPAVEARGWKVTFEVPHQLVRLFKSLNTTQTSVIASEGILPEYDVQCPLLDLPRILATPATASDRVPYLRAEAELRSFWRHPLPAKGFRVGIAWQGSLAHRNDRNRSVPLKHYSALSALNDVHLISLQKGHGVGQLDETSAGLRIHTLGDEYVKGGFHDTAALIMELDLVITVDTSVAHLAGALGRPVWIALPSVPDWRWQMRGSRSSWYPTARLFRRQNDWENVFIAMAGDLAHATPHRSV